MRRYTVRYLIVIILALLLIPMRAYLNSHTQSLWPWYTGTTGIETVSPIAPSFFSAGNAFYGIAMPSSHEGWVVGGSFEAVLDTHDQMQHIEPTEGLIQHYQDGNWLVSATLPEPLLSISMSSTHDGWAVGYFGQLDHYHGTSWKPSQAPIKAILSSVSMLSEQEGWAVGFNGTILHFQDQQWSVVPSPTSEDLLSIKMVSAQEGWIVGSHGTILHYSQQQWHSFHSPTNQTLKSISMLSAQEGWAVGDQSTILHYRAGIWSPVQALSSQNNQAFCAVALSSEQAGWIVGAQAALTYQQEVWQTSASSLAYTGDNGDWYAVAMSSPNDVWAVGSYDGIYHYRSGGWQNVSSR